MKNSKKGFTIVEMLTVIAVLAVLMTIVTTAASSAIHKARERRAQAMAGTIQNGIANYVAQYGSMPGPLGNLVDKEADTTGSGVTTISDNDYDAIMREMLNKSKAGNAVMDFAGLMAGPGGRDNGEANGIDFSTWLQRKKAGGKKLPGGMGSKSELTFGYALPNDQTINGKLRKAGKFCRFVITYNSGTDHVTVKTR